MALKERIASDMKEAMVKKDHLRLSTLRMLASAIHNKEIEKGKKETGLSEEEIMSVIQSEAKKRKDAAGEYERGRRDDLRQKELQELAVLKEYLPGELSMEELEKIVRETVKEVGASSEKDFGRVMKVLQPKVKARADGAAMAASVKKALGNE